MDDLRLIRSLNDSSRIRYGQRLLELIHEASQKTPDKITTKIKTQPKSTHREALIDLLMAVVRLRAEEHSLNPSALANRKDLEQLILHPAQSTLLQAWRKPMVGTELVEILQGQKQLQVDDGSIQIRTSDP